MYAYVEKKQRIENKSTIQRMKSARPQMTMGYMSKHPDDEYKEKLFSRTVKSKIPNTEVHHIIPISVMETKVVRGTWQNYAAANDDINSVNNTITLPAVAPTVYGGLPYHRRYIGDNHPAYSANVMAATANRHINNIPGAIQYADTHLRPVIRGFGQGNAIDDIPAVFF